MNASPFAAQLETELSPELLARLAEEISSVEQELQFQVGSQVELVRQIGDHTLRAGGKRLRPALVSIAAQATGRPYDRSRAHRLGACMELIHMATLMHDDVIDHATTRRGIETPAVRFGSTATILTGDVLLAKAMSILAVDGDIEIIRAVSKAVVDLAEGEVGELEARGCFEISSEDHFEILRRKTATFIGACCETGARVAGASAEDCATLREYGEAMGMAFQIADDLLDYTADPTKTGKPRGTDFGEGCATLPLILALPKMPDSERERIRGLFGRSNLNGAFETVHRQMSRLGVYSEAEEIANGYIRIAAEALDKLPVSPARELLRIVARYVVWRNA